MKILTTTLFIIIVIAILAMSSQNGNEIIIKKIVKFSDLTKKDTFILRSNLKCENYKKINIYFTIKNSSNKVIYNDTLTGSSMFDYSSAPEQNATNKEIEALVKDGMSHFFDDEKFSMPAISANQQFDSDLSLVNKTVYLEIKKNKNYPSFTYTILDESQLSIVYVKKYKKVYKF